MPLLAFFAFLSGIITILSPCILPVVPIIMSGSVGGKRKPLGIITGFTTAFTAFTLTLSALIRALNVPPDSLRIVSVILLAVFGLVMAVPRFQQLFETAASRLSVRTKSRNGNGFTGGVLVGAGLGLVWTPCVGPIMASVISLAVSSSVNGGAVLITLAYSAGTALPMLGIMFGGRRLLKRITGDLNTAVLQRVFGIIMIAAALSIGFGLDRRFQSAVLRVFPDYGSELTFIEQIKPVRNALKQFNDGNSDSEFKWEQDAGASVFGDYGKAPGIVTGGTWFNSDAPLTMENLRGKVVLLDFWTYSCVNCVRTIPYLKAWHDAYSSEGLVIIGVHTPEFAFERDPSNVEKAIADLGISWPVVLDNDFLQWKAYGNRFWPAHYFIDAEGRIRYFHFGEGNYAESENVIRRLIGEAGKKTAERAGDIVRAAASSRTPEIYLGFGRAEGFISEEAVSRDQIGNYRIIEKPGTGQWGLNGRWLITKEYITADGEGSLELGFNAAKVFMVIEPLDSGTLIEVKLDGHEAGEIQPEESRLYQLLDLQKAGEHLLELRISGYARLYTFTFG